MVGLRASGSSESEIGVPSESTQVVLQARPVGMLRPDTDFAVRKVPIPEVPPQVLDGGKGSDSYVLVRVMWVSCDPAMRGWMSTAPSYLPPVGIGETMRANGVGEIVRMYGDQRGKRLMMGNVVAGMLGWQEYAWMASKDVSPVKLPAGVPMSTALGVLGGTGLTAFFGLLDIGKPKRGEVVVVSSAAGATGSVAAQIAKNVIGCFTVGIAGGAKKCRYLTEDLKLDAAVDYTAAGGVAAGLKAALDGRTIDVYFDSVGGAVLEAALSRISHGARVVLCGAISSYNRDGRSEGSPTGSSGSGGSAETRPQHAPGPRNYAQLIVRRASMRGFIVLDYAPRYAAARRTLASWLRNGRVVVAEHVEEGLPRAPRALLALFEGRNTGKVVVRVAPPGARLAGMPAKL